MNGDKGDLTVPSKKSIVAPDYPFPRLCSARFFSCVSCISFGERFSIDRGVGQERVLLVLFRCHGDAFRTLLMAFKWGINVRSIY